MEHNERKDRRSIYGNLAYSLDSLARERQLDDAGIMSETEREAQPVLQKPEEKPMQRVQPVARTKVSPVLLGCIAVLIIGIVALMIGYTKLSEVTIASSELKAQLEELEVEHVSLLTKYEQTFDLARIKEIAEENGMQKPTSGQIEYVDLSGNDSVTVYQASAGSLWSDFSEGVSLGIQKVLDFFR